MPPLQEPTRRPTRQPSIAETVAPTDAPTLQPITFAPTDEPTAQPDAVLPTLEPTGQPTTSFPTVSPTQAPVAPTNNPTMAPTQPMVCSPPITLAQRQEMILDILNDITPEFEILTPGTSANAAFLWLVNEDSAQVCPEEELDVVQRYVIALYYFNFNGDNWDLCNAASSPSLAPCISGQQRYLSGANVCQWFNVTCDADEENILSVILGMFGDG